jgi:RimJ/RimL family protein N-acetyltransferase
MRQSVTIRHYEAADAPELLAAVHESLGDLRPWMPWATAAYSIADAEAWVRTTVEGQRVGAMYDFAVVDAAGRYVGGCGLNQIQRVNAVANLGYWIRSSAAGCGMAPVAVRLLIAWAFQNTNLNRLEILVGVGNTRSLRVAEKVGAHRDAVLRERLILDGRPSDAVLYSVVRSDTGIGGAPSAA